MEVRRSVIAWSLGIGAWVVVEVVVVDDVVVVVVLVVLVVVLLEVVLVVVLVVEVVLVVVVVVVLVVVLDVVLLVVVLLELEVVSRQAVASGKSPMNSSLWLSELPEKLSNMMLPFIWLYVVLAAANGARTEPYIAVVLFDQVNAWGKFHRICLAFSLVAAMPLRKI